jgi:hypothetical protein
MNILDFVLTREEFVSDPPILLDIGASGAIHPKWKAIAKYSICIAFDADDREMGYVSQESKTYRKLYIYKSIATDTDSSKVDFYLTKSPYCSSTLKPDSTSLSDFTFSELFEVQKQIQLPAVQLQLALKELNINRIDWFKTDSQGTDLRLFISLGKDIIDRVLVAEFEPGIIDAYEGEDKLYQVIQYMETQNFWMSSLEVNGCQRFPRSISNSIGSNKYTQQMLNAVLVGSPGWANVIYMNNYHISGLSKRDFLLGWAFAITEKQYGFALELAVKGLEKFEDEIFVELKNFVLEKIKISFYKKMPVLLSKKIVEKLLSLI